MVLNEVISIESGFVLGISWLLNRSEWVLNGIKIPVYMINREDTWMNWLHLKSLVLGAQLSLHTLPFAGAPGTQRWKIKVHVLEFLLDDWERKRGVYHFGPHLAHTKGELQRNSPKCAEREDSHPGAGVGGAESVKLWVKRCHLTSVFQDGQDFS